MKSIYKNPFRIIGVAANATQRELLSRKNKVAAFSRVGKQISSEYDFPFLSKIEITEKLVNKAFSNIEQNQNKVNNALFWFVDSDSIDHTAIQYLINGNKDKAIEIWEKLVEENKIISKKISAINNISTLYLLSNDPFYLRYGIISKIELIEADRFQDFVHAVADENFNVNKNKQIRFFIDEILKELKGKYSTYELIDLFSDCNDFTRDYISKKFAEDPIHQIESQIEQTNRVGSKGG